MENKKLEKALVKIGFGGLISVILGLVYKGGEKINETVDEKYEKEHGVDPKNKKPW